MTPPASLADPVLGRRMSRAKLLRHMRNGAGLALAGGLLAACETNGGPETAEGNGDAAGGDGLTLMTEASYEETVAELVQQYEEEHGVTFNLSYAETEQVQNVTRTQLASGTGGDLLHIWPGAGNSMAVDVVGPAGYLADLSDQAWVDDIPEPFQPLIAHDGATLMFSPGQALIGALYNRNLFEELGVDYPETWQELLELCEAARSAGYDPVALGIADPVNTQFLTYALVPSTVYADTPDFDERMMAGEATFADSGWREAFEKYLELEELGFFSDDALGTSNTEALELVMDGRALMTVVPVVGLPNIEAEYDMVDQLGVMAFPGNDDDPDRLWIPGAPSSGWGVNEGGPNEEAARDFLAWMGEIEQVNAFAEQMGLLPIIPNDDFDGHPGFDPIMPYVEDGRTVPFMDQRWPNPEVQQAHFAGVQELFAGQTSVDDVLARMDDAYQAGETEE